MSDTRRPDGGMGQDELDLYVDGLLDDERRAAFERQLFADPGLAAELERQRSLEARLSAAFPVPRDSAVLARTALAGGRRRHAGGRWLSALRVAAAAALLAALGLWAGGVFDAVDEGPVKVADEGGPRSAGEDPGASVPRVAPPGSVQRATLPELARREDPQELVERVASPGADLPQDGLSCVAYGGLYAELTDAWRQASAACGLPHDLARHFQDSLGQELLIDTTNALPIEGPIPLRRWPTTTLLASPQQPDPILILVDALARDPRPVLEAGSPAHLFRRELGDLVLYELTPWDSARLLGLFRLR